MSGQSLGRTRLVLICMVAALFYLYEFLVRVSPSAMVHLSMQHFQVNITSVGWLSALFFFGYVPMQLPGGLLLDYLGGRRLLAWATFLCALASVFFGLTDSLIWAGLLRFLMGICGAVAFIGALYVVSNWIPRQWFAMYTGLVQALGCLGAVMGQGPLASLSASYGYVLANVMVGVLGVIFSVLIFFIIPKPAVKKVRALDDRFTWARLKSVCHNKYNWSIAIYACLSWASINIFASLWGVPYLMQQYHMSASRAGWMIALVWLGVAVSSPLVADVSRRAKNRRGSMLFCVLCGLVSIVFILYVPHLAPVLLGFLLIIFGVSAAGQSISFDLCYANNEKHTLGTALGFNNMAVIFAGISLQPLVGMLLHWRLGRHTVHLNHYRAADFHIALSVMTICLVLNLVLVMLFPRRLVRSSI